MFEEHKTRKSMTWSVIAIMMGLMASMVLLVVGFNCLRARCGKNEVGVTLDSNL